MPQLQRPVPETGSGNTDNPLKCLKPPLDRGGEGRLWWAVVRRAALDLSGPEPWATDALEFWQTTGVWLCETFFGLAPEETRRAVAGLVLENPTLSDSQIHRAAGDGD